MDPNDWALDLLTRDRLAELRAAAERGCALATARRRSHRVGDAASPHGDGVVRDPLAVVALLVDVGAGDTVYRDVYLTRAATLLEPTLSTDDFHRLEKEHAELAVLPVSIERSLDHGDWRLVRDLSERMVALKQTVEQTKKLIEIARAVYAVADVRLDPFSPGLERFTHLSGKAQAEVRARAAEQLTVLGHVDGSWNDFYEARRAVIVSRTLSASSGDKAEGAPTVDARQAAAQALKAGDISRLARLAEEILTSVTPCSTVPATPVSTTESAPAVRAPDDLLVSYSSETLARARALGLAHRRLEGREQFASVLQYAWRPLYDERGHVDTNPVPLPEGASDRLADPVKMLVIHPLVNSGGARYLPSLVAEDMLVEDFPEPDDGEKAPASELIAALGLPGRHGVTRIAIERALLTHGSRVLEKDLGLDPRVFRLVCIPPDAYVRLGEVEGWGRQPFWTHFDGYLVMANGRLQALAGGDTRYGGVYEVLGVGADYDSDRLIVRFAVVQRERMVAR
jgi:hypothetical protein